MDGERRADIVLHPIRLRILRALGGGRRLTSQEIAATMPEEAPATLYRHIAKLVETKVVRVVETRQARGAVERVLAIVDEAVNLRPADIAKDPRRYFMAFVATMLDGAERFLSSRGRNAGELRYRFEIAQLDDDEYAALLRERDALLDRMKTTEARPGRRRRFVAVVTYPDIDGDTKTKEPKKGPS